MVAACLMGLVIGLVILSKPVPRRSRLSKTEKRVSEPECVAHTVGEVSLLWKRCTMAITTAAHSCTVVSIVDVGLHYSVPTSTYVLLRTTGTWCRTTAAKSTAEEVE